MCGRYALYTTPISLAEKLKIPPPPFDLKARYNIAPGTWILGVHYSEPQSKAVFDQFWWGFRPNGAGANAPQPINAKAENLETSRYFRGAFHRHRCLIPANGWYEWQNLLSGKQPYYITHTQKEPLFFAGVWEVYADQQLCCAIVTEPARGALERIHPRMPVVLDESAWLAWLDPERRDRDAIRSGIHHLPANLLTTWPVSTSVNRAANDDASLIKRADG